MDTFLQALVMAFREGLEGFLIISILLKFLDKTGSGAFKKYVWQGAYGGIFASVAFGIVLMLLSTYLGGLKTTAKLWESLAGFIAVILITTFIIWMIKNGRTLKAQIEQEVTLNLTKKGLILLTLFMVAREGTEIVIFSFAGKYEMLPVFIGLALSVVLVLLINYSLVKVNLGTIFTITLAYLILQAGYLLGYGVHEGLSALKSLGVLDESSPLFTKAFNVSKTIFNHKQGVLGLPLNVLFGWYSKPEMVQFILQYSYTFLLFGFWYKTSSKR